MEAVKLHSQVVKLQVSASYCTVKKGSSFYTVFLAGNNQYTIWYYEDRDLLSWVDNLLELETGDAETTFRYLGKLAMPSELRSGTDLCVFRHSVVPMWEDIEHDTAGRIVLSVPRSDLDVTWEQTLMLFFNRVEMDSVSGLYLQKRCHMSKIALWLSSQDAEYEEKYWTNHIAEMADFWRASISASKGHLRFISHRLPERTSQILASW